MPHLSSFAELAALIFAANFAIYYLFANPQQILARMLGGAAFAVCLIIDNQQTYSFSSYVTHASMILGGAAIAAGTKYMLQISARPEKEYERQKTLEKKRATSKRAVEQARANYVSYVNQKANAEAQLLQMQASLSEANANLAKAKADLGAPGDQNAKVRQAKANVRSAELNLEFTQVKAPVDGYVTNLNLRLSSQAVENQAILALVAEMDLILTLLPLIIRDLNMVFSCSFTRTAPLA